MKLRDAIPRTCGHLDSEVTHEPFEINGVKYLFCIHCEAVLKQIAEE